VTLGAVCILASFGPWNAGRVAYWSQITRLQRLLITNGVLVNGSISPMPKRLDLETEKQVSSILQDLHSPHTLDEVQAWRQTRTAFTGPIELMTTMGMTYRHQGERQRRFHVYAEPNVPIVITGFDRLFQFQVSRHRDTSTVESDLGNDLVAWLEEDFKTLSVLKKSSQTHLRLDLAPLVLSMTSSAAHHPQFSLAERTIERQAPGLHCNSLSTA
jgi:hypothetical protein